MVLLRSVAFQCDIFPQQILCQQDNIRYAEYAVAVGVLRAGSQHILCALPFGDVLPHQCQIHTVDQLVTVHITCNYFAVRCCCTAVPAAVVVGKGNAVGTQSNCVIQTDKLAVVVLPQCRLDQSIFVLVPLAEVVVDQSAGVAGVFVEAPERVVDRFSIIKSRR